MAVFIHQLQKTVHQPGNDGSFIEQMEIIDDQQKIILGILV